MDGGCLARRACPVGTACRYAPDQMRFHMVAFRRARVFLSNTQGKSEKIAEIPRLLRISSNQMYAFVEQKLMAGDDIILDGGTGTEIQRRGVPMHDQVCARRRP